MVYKALIVDDEAAVRELFADLLKGEKCLVQAVGSGEEALELIAQEDFGVVLLDIKLPGISGIEVLKKIKEQKPKTIVVVITGFGYDENLLAKSKDLGCSGYIGKNMPISQIMGNLRLFIKATEERLKKDLSN